jgi:hypothetical protein
MAGPFAPMLGQQQTPQQLALMQMLAEQERQKQLRLQQQQAAAAAQTRAFQPGLLARPGAGPAPPGFVPPPMLAPKPSFVPPPPRLAPQTPGGSVPSQGSEGSQPSFAFNPAGGIVTSRYRTPEHNREVGGVANSWHTRGTPENPLAMDSVKPAGMTWDQYYQSVQRANPGTAGLIRTLLCIMR